MDTEDKPGTEGYNPSGPGHWSRWVFAGVAAAVWLVSVFAHDLGEALAQSFFLWVQEPGVLHPAGGRPRALARGRSCTRSPSYLK